MTRQTRKIVKLDEDKCDGCGLCVPDCAEGAIRIIDGKARLIAETLCDGLGNCLGACPNDAITIEERPADEFDEKAVHVHLQQIAEQPAPAVAAAETAGKDDKLPCGCPGTMMRKFTTPAEADQPSSATTAPRRSQLGQWPVQLTLLPVASDIWRDAHVLIAADCVSFAMADFHERLLVGKTLAIACPKLDDTQPYVDKLAKVFVKNAENNIKSITVARMEVPCCGIDYIVQEALEQAGATIPVNVVIVSVTGEIQSVNGVAVV